MLALHIRLLQPHNHQERQGSTVSFCVCIKTEAIQELKRACWCHTASTSKEQKSHEWGKSCRGATMRRSGSFLELQVKCLSSVQTGSWLQPPLLPCRLFTCFKSIPALVLLFNPCKSHMALSLSPHWDRMLPISSRCLPSSDSWQYSLLSHHSFCCALNVPSQCLSYWSLGGWQNVPCLSGA